MNTTTAAPGFNVADPLPRGVTVLEASAGTGKTYAIAGLAARYVAEGTPLDRLLLVTFTRMATGELRERVRDRLITVERALKRREPAGDRVAELLLAGDVEESCRRLGQALADFDAATIATTHGFCQEVLAGLGVSGDVEREYKFVDEVDDLVEEVVGDLYLRRTIHRGTPPFGYAEALKIGTVAVGLPAAPIEPAAAENGSKPAMRRAFADWVRREVDARKRRRALLSYDDLLTRLHAALRDSPSAVDRLRERYSVVLVDEFQDTDPVQWDILRRAFGEGGTSLVLIGDPKQAIYAFRGADVFAYLDAAVAAETRRSLETNWRSDQPLIDAHDALFGDVQLGHPEIVYREVEAAACHRAPRLTGARQGAALRFRLVERGSVAVTGTGYAETGSVRAHIAEDLAGDVVRLLTSGALLEAHRDDGSRAGEPRIVAPGDLAVLVRKNATAKQIRDALQAVGVPAVLAGAGSVFATTAAEEWLRLLEALERPGQDTRARAAALSSFLGWNAERTALAGEEEWEAIHRLLHTWARVLRERGVASLTEAINVSQSLPARVLRGEDGERRLTDLRHVAQLLHDAAARDQMGVAALGAWLRRRISEAETDNSDEERSRRLESDADAIQVITIHRSKGLEFPIVYCPDLWDEPRQLKGAEPVRFHDPAEDDAWKIHVGLQGSDYAAAKRRAIEEQRGEDLRLAYVALTRARHRAVVWWAPAWASPRSALGRLVFGHGADGTVAQELPGAPTDGDAFDRFEGLAARAGGAIAVEPARLGTPERWSGALGVPRELDAARFDRWLDLTWQRTSYSAMTAATHEDTVSSEYEVNVVEDEPGVVSPSAAEEPPAANALRTAPLLLHEMPVGAGVGTFVHRVMEEIDFAADDLDDQLAARVKDAWVDVGPADQAAAGLRAFIDTPLGPMLDDLRLRDFARANRMDELAFELPLAGGERPTGSVTPAAIATVLRQHTADNDALRFYADRLEDPRLRPSVHGFLTGSIDSVLRLPGPRFAIVDYKTNWLAPPESDLSAWHYRPAALVDEMGHRHHGLQALLYTVALHRYLRWRLPGYDAGRHLAGVLYLFVRGMIGAETPRADGKPCGVFAWRPPGALVEALSDLLDRGAPVE